jgi:cation diffusion facilitator family transporter
MIVFTQKHHSNFMIQEKRDAALKEKKNAAFYSVIAAIILTGFKLIVGILTNSLGILSEALHSALDLVAAVITYFSVRVSDIQADKKHNFGHGKIENFSALMETILLLITCTWIIYEAVNRLISNETEIRITVWSYIVVITSIIIDINRSRMLYKVAKKYNSQALEADALHFSTDIWSSSVVLLGLICANFGFFAADSIAALVVAAIVLVVSYKLGKKAVDVLLDKAPQEIIHLVEKTLATFPEAIKFHRLKVRTAGADTFIKVNIHFDPDLTLREVHKLCDKIEKTVHELIPRSELYVHAEPQDPQHIEKEQNENN